MSERLDEKIVRDMGAPEAGYRVVYDGEVAGFGVRITKGGARAFVLNYRASGRERRITIGSWPDWTVKAAREEAKALKRRVDVGEDPMAERHADRAAKTVGELAEHYRKHHLPKNRPGSQDADEILLTKHILPQLRKIRIAKVRHADVAALHRKVSETAPIAANRVVALLSKMFAIAVKEEWRSDNPAKGIERNPENKRERYLTPAEIGRLTEALDAHRNKSSANAVRLLLLTGARRGEMLGATWDQFDLAAGVWVKPASTTKQKRIHRIPLSAPALQLLVGMRAEAEAAAEKARVAGKKAPDLVHVFPGHGANDSQGDLKRFWASVCEKAKISGVRVHDLRHTHASILASAGLSLPIIGALLGHSQPSTTARYAHLLDDPLRAATERVGAIVTGASKSADVIPLKRESA